MNHYTALEIQREGKPSGLYHYVCSNDRTGTHPLGYCRTNESGERCPGHPSKEEAQEHYKKYLLDTLLRFANPESPDSQRKCQVCSTWTSGYASIPIAMRQFDLCPEHQTREAVAGLFEIGESWGS